MWWRACSARSRSPPRSHASRHPDAKGLEVDLAATEALFRLLEPLPVEHEQLGQARSRSGNRASYTAPSNMYRSADDQFSLVASSDIIFARMCKAIGRPRWADDPRFATNPARVRISPSSTRSSPRGSPSRTRRSPRR